MAKALTGPEKKQLQDAGLWDDFVDLREALKRQGLEAGDAIRKAKEHPQFAGVLSGEVVAEPPATEPAATPAPSGPATVRFRGVTEEDVAWLFHHVDDPAALKSHASSPGRVQAFSLKSPTRPVEASATSERKE